MAFALARASAVAASRLARELVSSSGASVLSTTGTPLVIVSCADLMIKSGLDE